MERWDYIIVGAGSAGCVLANRLSADPSLRVLLLESGPPDRSPYIHVPAAIIKAVGNPALDWCLLAEPDPSRHGKVDLWPAGRTLGGSSSINGMLYVRGAREDFDGWAALGNAGWSYAEVLPYFQRLEASEVGDPKLRGKDGPLHEQRLRTTHPLGPVFLEAAAQCGAPLNPDYNGVTQEGASPPQVTQRDGWRWSSARAFLGPARGRANLRIETGATVAALEFDGRRCSGVRLQPGAGTAGDGAALQRRLAPGGEVVLAAGALGSPKLLMLSGIGPAQDLRALGIAPRVDRAAVGGNLQEHPNSLVCAHVGVHTYNQDATPLRMAWNAARWLLTGRGPASSPYPHAVAFLRSDPSEPCPDLQFLFGPFAFSFDERGILPYLGPAVSIVVNTCRPRARGSLHLRSADPAAPPRIEHALLSDADDLRRQVAGCRIARQLLSAPAFAPWGTREYLPGPGVDDDAQWEAHIRRTSFLGYHPVGTCRMGNDDDAVVTPELAVRGVDGLSVADASVMPRLIAANTNAATMMIAEKASDLLLLRRRAAARAA